VSEKPVQQQPPDVLAMVLADTVLQEPATGKFFIQGTYSVIMATDFPWPHPNLTVYFAITNGHGKTPIKVRLVDVDEDREPIFQMDAVLDFADPLVVVESVFTARGVQFPEPGEYRLQFFGAGEPLRERRIQVIPRQGRHA
jgi:uncharacterized protein DUF6941